MIIIPAIDIVNGKCVRLSQGDFEQQKIYSESPLEMAKSFEDAGLQYLHIVDLDGAKTGKVKHWDIVESITSQTKLKVDFGGGIKTEEEITRLLAIGVQQVNLGSIAYREPIRVKSWLQKFGPQRIILSADSNNERLAVTGWQDQTKVPLIDFIQDFVKSGLQYATCTDIAKDGMMAGANVELYKKIISAVHSLTTNNQQPTTFKLIASGGVNSLQDLESLKTAGCYGCIVGKAIYEGSVSVKSLSEFNSSVNSVSSVRNRKNS
jgi:phosphoribosylformimino-5-aminoimidazole carboxamide ribotide isomerase